MAELTRNILLEKARQSLKDPAFLYKGVDVWPFIRISVYMSIKQGRSPRELSKTSARMLFIVKGFFGFLKLMVSQPRIETLFATSSVYKVTEEGAMKDRIIDPFISYCREKSFNFKVLEFTNRYAYDKRLNYLNDVLKLQPVLYFLSMFWRLEFLLRRKSLQFPEEKTFNSFLKQAGITFQINTAFKWRLFLLFKQFQFYKWFFARIRLKRLLMVCFYDIKSLPMIMATRQLAVPSIDLQHGVQNRDHFAYYGWSQDESQSPFIPTHFYVWDESSFEVIASWRGRKNTLLGCNKWVLERIHHQEKKYILYSLQPVPDPFPGHLIATIKKYNGKYEWVFRLHPQQVPQRDDLDRQLQQLGVRDRVLLMTPMEETLMASLSKTWIHVTKFSTVAIEASHFGIPTVFLEEKGLGLFKDSINNDLLHDSSCTDFVAYLDGYKSEDAAQTHLKVNNLKRFETIGEFFS